MWKLCNTNLIGQVKCRLQGCHKNIVRIRFSILGGVEGRAYFFKLDVNKLACFLIATYWQNSKSIERLCYVSSKVQALAVCWESSTISVAVTRSFETTELGTCLAVNATVYCAEAYKEWCILNLELYFPCTGLGKLVTLNVIQWCSEVPVTLARPYIGCSVDSYCILYSGCFCGVLIFVISPGVMKFSTHKLFHILLLLR